MSIGNYNTTEYRGNIINKITVLSGKTHDTETYKKTFSVAIRDSNEYMKTPTNNN